MPRLTSVEGGNQGGELGRACANHPLRIARFRVARPAPPGYFKLSVLCQDCMMMAQDGKGIVVQVGRR